MVSCSEDGTIRIYDEIKYLQDKEVVSDNNQNQRWTSRNKNESLLKKERFVVVLTPEEFRRGAKNKKIDSVHVSKDGLVAAGSDKGDIFLWELDI